MTREELENAPYAAPVTKQIQVGRTMMLIGSILLFVYAVGLFVEFILSLANPSMMDVEWSDPLSAFHVIMLPFIMVFLTFVGIGGITYIRNKGPFLRWASIGAIILGIVILVDFILDIRTLSRSLADPDISNTTAWVRFVLGFVGLQIFGGVYFVGWFLAKNYLD